MTSPDQSLVKNELRRSSGLATLQDTELVRSWFEFRAAFISALRERASIYPRASQAGKLDLLGLEISVEKVERLKRTALFTKIFASEAAVWSALYVLEDSTLADKFSQKPPYLKPSAEISRKHLGRAYGQQTAFFWSSLHTKLEVLGFANEEIRKGIESAEGLFDFFSDYLEN